MLGQATFHSSFAPEEALIVVDELQRSRQRGIILADDLHLYVGKGGEGREGEGRGGGGRGEGDRKQVEYVGKEGRDRK